MSLQISLAQAQDRIELVIQSLISLLLAILSSLVFVLILNTVGFDINLIQLFRVAFITPLQDLGSVSQIIYNSGFLVLTALAVAISFKAGLFNIGGQGQMSIGGVFAAIFAANIVPMYLPFLNLPILLPLLVIFVGFLGGALWGFIPGYLKAKTGAHEVITTIMMNLIAVTVIQYLVGTPTYSPFVDKSRPDAYGQSDSVLENARLSTLFPEINKFLNTSLFFIIIVILISHFLVYRTRFGYQLRAVGYNKEAAEASGINSERITIYAMTLSGGIAGLGGAFYVMGTSPYKYIFGFEGTLGFDGIAVSLIAANSPLIIGITALFFGFLRESKNELDSSQVLNVPPDLVFVLQSFIILFAAAPILSRNIYSSVKQLMGNIKKPRRDEDIDDNTTDTDKIKEETE